MKRRNLTALLLAALMLAAVLTGCGASSKSEAADVGYSNSAEAPMAEEMGAEVLYSSGSTADSAAIDTSSQKLIRRVSIDAETEDLETLLSQLSEQISGLNGYIEEQELYNGSSYSSYRYRSAYLVVRIPAENLDGFVSEVKGISNVVTYNESTEDVTLTYVATESRITALETEEARLLELLAKAETMSDLLEIEARLTDVRSELESVNSQLRVLRNQVSYATVTLSIEQVKVYTEVEEPTVWQRITSGFSRNIENIGESLVDFFVWAVTYSPQLIFWAVVIAAVIVMVRRSAKKRKKNTPPPQDEGEKK